MFQMEDAMNAKILCTYSSVIACFSFFGFSSFVVKFLLLTREGLKKNQFGSKHTNTKAIARMNSVINIPLLRGLKGIVRSPDVLCCGRLFSRPALGFCLRTCLDGEWNNWFGARCFAFHMDDAELSIHMSGEMLLQ
jgi:hypothetical protein